MSDKSNSGEAVWRAALPFMVQAADVARHLPNLTEDEARALLSAGQFGRPLLIGGEPVVLRDRFVAAFEKLSSNGRDLLDILQVDIL